MAQLVEDALEEEIAIKLERVFKRNIPEKGHFVNQGIRNVPTKRNERNERREVRVATAMCYRCKKKGHISRNCRELPLSIEEGHVKKGHDYRNMTGNGQRGCQGNRR